MNIFLCYSCKDQSRKGRDGVLNNDAANKIKENARRSKTYNTNTYVKLPKNSTFYKVFGGLCFLAFVGAAVNLITGILPLGFLPSGENIAGSVVSMIIFGFFSYQSLKAIRFNTRYKKYYSIIKNKEVIIIDDLDDLTGIKTGVIASDLERAARKKLIPQGHMGRNNMLFFTRDSLYDKYIQNPDEYERNDSRKIRDEEAKKEKSERAEEILQTAKKYIYGIRESNALIDSEEVTIKLDRMEKLVSQIFDEAYKDPDKVSELGMFMNYYLPTTKKLLSKYSEIEERGFAGDVAGSTKLEIEQSLDVINTSFELILNKLYKKESVDISADIKTMEAMMKQEGLSSGSGRS